MTTRKPRKPQVRKPEWDTPEQKAARMRTRRRQLKQFAIAHGYTSFDALATALLNGKIKIVESTD